jgi:hypothetical protein
VADVVDFAYQGAGSEATPPRRKADWAGLAGGGLIVAGIVLGLVYAFLTYRLPADGAQQFSYLLQTALSTGVEVASAALVVAGSWPAAASVRQDSRSRRRVCGGLLGASMGTLRVLGSLTLLGWVLGEHLRIVDLPLSVTSSLTVAAGSVLSLVRKGGLASVGRPGRPRRADALPLVLLAITVAGALATWVPAWIQYTFTGSTGPHSEELGYAFDAPWEEIAVTVGQMIVIVAMAAAAALWRPARFGAVLLTGAVLFLADEAIQGIGEVIEAPSRASFGIPAAARMTVSVAGTPWMWAFCGFTAALIVVYEWLFIRGRPRPRPAAGPVTWMEPATPGTADDPLLPLPPSPTGKPHSFGKMS